MQHQNSQPAIDTEKLLHRVPAAARRLDISPAQAYNLINRGELTAIRLGKSLRIPEWALQKIAAGGNVTT